MNKQIESIVLGGGCFWCTEAAYKMVRGVVEVMPGYAGGHSDTPSYYDVYKGRGGHAEVVKVEFDPDEVTLKQILDVFWTIHDPTTPNQQGSDVGIAYRSIILYHPKQREVVEQSVSAAQKLWGNIIVTELRELEEFYPAEPEHKDYFELHPEQAYCQLVINPKLEKLRQKYAKLLN